MIHRSIANCRLCRSEKLVELFELGTFVSCGYFPEPDEEDEPAAPLCLLRCEDCGLVQLKHDFELDELYKSTYGYRSGINQTMTNHLAGITDEVVRRLALRPGDVVLDIGSNDGTLLKSYRVSGLRCFGMDPTIAQFGEYYPSDIATHADYFAAEPFWKLTGGGRAKAVTAIAMFYDLPDPNAFVADVAAVLDPDGLVVLEQSYLPAMVEHNAFDTICHEHLEYYALRQVSTLLARHGLRVVDVELNDANGGSFRVYACPENAAMAGGEGRVDALLAREAELGYDTVAPLEALRQGAFEARERLLEFLNDCKQADKLVHGYGASTKGNTILQFCGIGTELVEEIADRNPRKWGRRTPGTRIPIVSEEESRSRKPDYFLVFPWHFRDEFLARERAFLEAGGHLVFPLPRLEIL